jgi:hypothetical protein
MELPALLGSFNVAKAESLKCRLWIDRNLKANWRANLLVLMEVSEGLVSFSHIFSGRCVTDARGICTTRDSNQALYMLK